MKNKPNPNLLRSVEFKVGNHTDRVVGFCIEETSSHLKIASTYGNQGFTDITVVDISKITGLKNLMIWFGGIL